uniref:VP2.1 n=1 Tax=Lychas mucronatus TaxID=172552 RepID=A0A0U1S9P8_LYCMC|nr:VP2.1 [Lychas mucronatus]
MKRSSLAIIIVSIIVLSLWSETEARKNRRCSLRCSNRPKGCHVVCSWDFGKREITDSVDEDASAKDDEGIFEKLANADLNDDDDE